MPLIRRDPSGASAPKLEGDAVTQLSDANPDVRWKAARALGKQPDAVPALAAALHTETLPQVREAIFTSLVLIRTDASARAAAEFVRSEDAALRSGALDALAAMPDVVERILSSLLQDADSDVRILSCDLARTVPGDVATRLLGALLQAEAEPNVCGAAVEVLAEVGTADAIGPLTACKARFPGEAFLGFAIDDAIERVGAERLDMNG
ncbi:MAG TPA: HEAT repeat domain-containing protein [Hyphomonadaceae bacterium]|jgi:HEAT repeat protein|nr:HEAT repeat domain-containing protein [Hyphomonadaceae bacterium]